MEWEVVCGQHSTGEDCERTGNTPWTLIVVRYHGVWLSFESIIVSSNPAPVEPSLVELTHGLKRSARFVIATPH